MLPFTVSKRSSFARFRLSGSSGVTCCLGFRKAVGGEGAGAGRLATGFVRISWHYSNH